jgi:hypothetical protein
LDRNVACQLDDAFRHLPVFFVRLNFLRYSCCAVSFGDVAAAPEEVPVASEARALPVLLDSVDESILFCIRFVLSFSVLRLRISKSLFRFSKRLSPLRWSYPQLAARQPTLEREG